MGPATACLVVLSCLFWDGCWAVLNCQTNTRPNRESTACLANAGYYIASAGTVFPPSPFMSSSTFTSGSETFTASASSYWVGSPVDLSNYDWKAFSGSVSSSTSYYQWTTSTGPYSGGGIGAYTGTVSTVVDGGAILGEWLQLQSTVQHTLGSFSIMACYGNPTRAPKAFVLTGSNNGVTWTSLTAVSSLASWTANLVRTFTVPTAQAYMYFRLIVTNTTGTSETFLTIDKLKLYDAQVTTCTGTCASGTKFCLPDGTSSVCCTSSQYFITGISTACVTCPANSAPDLVYQERCVANAGYLGPSLYMFDGTTSTYRNLGSRTVHTVTPVGWRPTFGTVVSRFGAYFDSSVNGNYYTVVNDYNTITLAFWMYLSGTYDTTKNFQYEPMSMRAYATATNGFNFDLGTYPAASNTGAGFLYVCYPSGCGNAVAASPTFLVSTWLHVVLVIPNSPSVRQQKIYVNGVLKGTRPDTPTQDFLNYQVLLLAANIIDSRYYKGYLQQLAMYNYAMSDAEVTTLYNSGTPIVFLACAGTCATGWTKHCMAAGVVVCCPPGTYFRDETDTACQACPVGTYSAVSASSCTLCPAGTYSLLTNRILASGCLACPANSVSSAGSTSCVSNTGYYNLNDHLLAYYPFSPENVYADASGGGYVLTNTNGASYAPSSEFSTGPFPGAGVTYFNNQGTGYAGVTISQAVGAAAQSFRVSVGSGLDLFPFIGTSGSPGPGFSWCYWMRGADGATAGTVNSICWQMMMGFFSSFASTTNQIIDYRDCGSDSSKKATEVYISSASRGITAANGIFTRNWVHTCMTMQGKTVNLYANCASSTCSPVSVTLTLDPISVLYTAVLIGQGAWSPAFFGWFSDVRFYKKALTAAEVFAVRSYSGATAFSVNGDPSLLAYYPFSSSDIYADASGNGYTLSSTYGPSNAPTYDAGTYPFVGANAVFLDNSNVGSTSVTSKSFKINMGSGLDLSLLFGTAAIPGPGFTVCTWYLGNNGAGAGSYYQVLFSMLSQSIADYETIPLSHFTVYRETQTTSMTINYSPTGSNGVSSITAGTYLTTWSHLCAAGYGQTINIYYNCASRTCAPVVLPLGANIVSQLYPYAYIGKDYGTPWYGWVSEFRMYRKALTAAEVFAVKSYDGISPTAVNSVNSGLLAYYPFHPNAFLTDASGVTGSLVPTGSPASIAGSMTDLQNVAYLAQAGGLGNTNAGRQFFTIPQISLGPSCSICLWYNPDSSSASLSRIITLVNSATNAGMISIRREEATSNVAIEIYNAASLTTANTGVWPGRVLPGLFLSGIWHHLCLTLSGTAAKVYYQGVLFDTITLSAQKERTTYTSSFLGQNQWTNGDLYRGQLDEVRIYSRAISASEVTSIYNFRGDTYNPSIVLPCPNPCGAGKYGFCYNNGTQTCASCPVGTYSSVAAATSSAACLSCVAGTYTAIAGTAACTSCPANSWSAGGAVKCVANTGYYNLDNNLKAYYPFNSDGFLRDVTGITGSLTASASSPTAQDTGPFGAGSNSAFLTGSASTAAASNQYFQLPSLKLTSDMSVCSWYWISSSITRGWNRIFDFGLGVDNENVLMAIDGSSTTLRATVRKGATSVSIADTSRTNAAPATTWKHVCFTISGTSGNFWIDNVAQAFTMSNTRNYDTLLTSNFIGRSNFPNDLYWYGAFDEFRIYTKALPATEVAALYAFRGDTYAPMIILACSPCAAGAYGSCDSNGALTCSNCLAGAYSTGTGMTSSATCVSCIAGTYSGTAAVSVCTSCSPGTYSIAVGALTSSVCTACGTGTYSGTTGAGTSGTCTPCSAGTYSGATAATSIGTCTSCGTGTYSATAGLSACTPCAAGTYYGGTGASLASVCSACVAGTYSAAQGAASSATCTPCVAGTFSAVQGAASSATCAPCVAGMYSAAQGAASSSTCTPCRAGTYSAVQGAASSLTCTACIAGTFSAVQGAASSATCTPCGTGTYSAVQGAASSATCSPCWAGTYSAVQGAASSLTCTACIAGTFSAVQGAASSATCAPCVAGTYSAAQGAASSLACTPCAIGTFSSATGAPSSTTCTTCAAGTSAGTAGSTVCVPCLTALTCPSGQTPRCSPTMSTPVCCGKNQFFREGTDLACQTCPVASFSIDGSGTACDPCTTSPIETAVSLNPDTSPGTMTVTYDVPNYRVFSYTSYYNGNTFKSVHDVSVALLLVGAGGGGGGQSSGGGGGGTVMLEPKNTVLGGDSIFISLGSGGSMATSGTGIAGDPGGPARFWGTGLVYYTAYGGGGGGAWNKNKAGRGGSGGGGGACDLTNCAAKTGGNVDESSVFRGLTLLNGNPGITKYFLANRGGYGSLMNAGATNINNGIHGGGGGGAGAAGGDEVVWTASCSSGNQAACGRCGYGGDGAAGITIDGAYYNFSAMFGVAYTSRAQNGYVGGGGGGGGFSTYGMIKCKGGLGGGGAGYEWSGTTAYPGENGLPNTGGGGGGANDYLNSGGTGGSGLVLVRVPAFCVCPAGTYSGLESCTGCPAGMYSTGTGLLNSAACMSCLAGTFLATTGGSSIANCSQCGKGTYGPTAGLSVCTSCTAGTYSAALGAVASSACSNCASGSYSSVDGASACTSCAGGAYSGTGASECVLCTAGTYLVAALSTCSPCGAGTFSLSNGVTVCTPCPAGTYSESTGASLAGTCLSCSAGTYSAASGASGPSACTGCSAGTYSGALGLACIPSQLTWLFRDNRTGYYYLNFSNPHQAMRNYDNNPTYNTWYKLRFNSTLGYSSTFHQMYVGSVGDPTDVCLSTTFDATYATYAPGNSLFVDFGGTASCHYWATTTISFVGLPFSLSNAGSDWWFYAFGTCAYAGQMSLSCSDAQTCVLMGYGRCGGANWRGKAYVYNTSMYQTDINTACAMYGSSAYLSCNGGEILCPNSCTACPAGTYFTGTGLTSGANCVRCIAGTYSSGTGATTSGACLSCLAGTYLTGTGLIASSSCSACTAGQYSTVPGATAVGTCQLCFAGSYFTGTGLAASASCTSCTAGQYSTNLGATAVGTCQLCFAGTYFTGTGLAASASCVRCTAGQYSTNLGATAIGTCQLCFAGTYFTGTGLAASASCTSCTAGLYSTNLGAITAGTCQLCFAGTYFTGTGLAASASCTSCTAGQYSTNLGATAVGTCQLCFAGTYFTGTGLAASASCVRCTAGQYSTVLGGTTPSTCLLCFAGTYFTGTGLAASASCTSCTAGLYSTNLGATIVGTCQLCFAGTYFTGTGLAASASCSACGAGLYSTASGAIASGTCLQCLQGTYSTGTGLAANASCTQCLPGSFSAALGAVSSATCTACTAGTYATESMAVECTPCPTSSDSPVGSSLRGSCVCNAGYAGNLAVLANTCAACPVNSYCQGLSQTACPSHTHSPAQSSLQAQCRCDAGYRCTYRRNVTFTLLFNLDSAGFTSQAGAIKSTLATLADVPLSGVSLLSLAQVIYIPPPPSNPFPPPPGSALM